MTSLLLNIQNARHSLTRTELQIADYILKNPQLVISKSIQELASEIPTSASSIVRFSQKFCGNGGFSELKIQLSAESSNESELYHELSPTDSINSLKKKMSFHISQSINNTSATLENDQLDQAVQLIQNNDTILAFGIGASELAVRDLQQKFLRVGKHVIVIENLHILTTLLLANRESTAVILISNSGETLEVLKLARIVQSLSLPIISITQKGDNSLQKIADVSLLTDTTSENINLRTSATTSLISQLYTNDLLYYDYFALDYPTNLKLIEKSQRYIKEQFGKEN